MKIKVLVLNGLILASTFAQISSISDAQEPEPNLGTIVQDLYGIEMVYVPAGTFEMGIAKDKLMKLCTDVFPLNPAYECRDFVDYNEGFGIYQTYLVDMPAFWIDQYEVTIEHYQGNCLDYPELIQDCDDL